MTAGRPPLRVVRDRPLPSSDAASRAAHPSALGPRRSSLLRQLGGLAGRALVAGIAGQLGRELVYRVTR